MRDQILGVKTGFRAMVLTFKYMRTHLHLALSHYQSEMQRVSILVFSGHVFLSAISKIAL